MVRPWTDIRGQRMAERGIPGTAEMCAHQLLEHAFVEHALVLPAMVVFLLKRRAPLAERALCLGRTTLAWLLYSRQFQCFSNSARQFSRSLVILWVAKTVARRHFACIEREHGMRVIVIKVSE